MRRGDAAVIARFVGRGRAEGAFVGESEPTVAELLRYQRDVDRDGGNYRCLVVEDQGRVIGYLDHRRRGADAELLGLYLEPRARGRGLGRHLLRWVVADLRAQGCALLTTSVLRDNARSLRTARAVGFQPLGRAAARGAPAGTLRLRRALVPLEAVGRPRPLYAALTGENLYLHHLALAEALATRLMALPQVETVLGLGSLARGFADSWSDLDIAVLGRGRGLAGLWRGERWISGTSVDLYVVDLDKAPPARWDRTRRQAFEESVVLAARAPRTRARLAVAVALGDQERRAEVRDLLFKIGWLGFEPRRWHARIHHGYRWALPHDLWIRRGSVASAHTTVDRVLDFVLQLLFLANRERPPDAKWRRYLVPGLVRRPRNLESVLASIEQAPRDRAGFARRARSLLALVEWVVRALAARGDLVGDLYRAQMPFFAEYDPTR